jgi:soluble lytic murein transglycosylase-like protein
MTLNEVYSIALNNAFWIKQNLTRFSNIDPYALARVTTAIAKVESNFNEKAKNTGSSARGLMQILICTQREIELKYLKIEWPVASLKCSSYPKAPVDATKLDKMYSAKYSLLVGQVYLCYQYNRKSINGDWQKAIFAYNQGSFNGKQAGYNYLKKVNAAMNSIDFKKLESISNTTKSLILDGSYLEFL